MKLENLKRLFTDEDAVSPVIGVILMVAITVILAAIIGTFVLGLGEKTGDTAPQASFTFEYNETADKLTVTHDGGDKIDAARMNVTMDGANQGTWATITGTTDDVSAGDTAVISSATASAVDPDATVRVVWTGDNGDSATLAKWSGPDA